MPVLERSGGHLPLRAIDGPAYHRRTRTVYLYLRLTLRIALGVQGVEPPAGGLGVSPRSNLSGRAGGKKNLPLGSWRATSPFALSTASLTIEPPWQRLPPSPPRPAAPGPSSIALRRSSQSKPVAKRAFLRICGNLNSCMFRETIKTVAALQPPASRIQPQCEVGRVAPARGRSTGAPSRPFDQRVARGSAAKSAAIGMIGAWKRGSAKKTRWITVQ